VEVADDRVSGWVDSAAATRLVADGIALGVRCNSAMGATSKAPSVAPLIALSARPVGPSGVVRSDPVSETLLSSRAGLAAAAICPDDLVRDSASTPEPREAAEATVEALPPVNERSQRAAADKSID
jgi:hypothetical protein